MSRQFFTNADHLDVATATVTAMPCTLFAWVKDLGFGSAAGKQIFNVGQAGTGNSACRIMLSATDGALAQVTDTGGTSSSATCGTLFPNGSSWHPVGGNFLSTTSRDIYFDGANKASNVQSRTLGVFDSMRICSSLIGNQSFVGLIAHVALWDITLSDEEHRLLSCYTPNLVQPTHLVEYWDLLTDGTSIPSSGTNPHSMVVTGSKFSIDNPSFAAAWPYSA